MTRIYYIYILFLKVYYTLVLQIRYNKYSISSFLLRKKLLERGYEKLPSFQNVCECFKELAKTIELKHINMRIYTYEHI